jgi:hypothetical protein
MALIQHGGKGARRWMEPNIPRFEHAMAVGEVAHRQGWSRTSLPSNHQRRCTDDEGFRKNHDEAIVVFV